MMSISIYNIYHKKKCEKRQREEAGAIQREIQRREKERARVLNTEYTIYSTIINRITYY